MKKFGQKFFFEESLVLIIKHLVKYLAKILLSFLFIPMEGNDKKNPMKYFS